jgi:ubiquinone biosynthesis protein
MASMKQRIERTTHLIGIAVRHGYGGLLARIGWSVPSGKGATVQQVTAEQLRDSLAEAGVTFVKLGQKLSSRPDLLPKEYVDALATLQESVPDPPVDELLSVLTEELGRPAEEVFAEFDSEPVAAASIGVVFRARLPEPDGREVAVKIQRPEVAQQVAADLHILADIAAGLERHVPALRRFEPTKLVKEFREALQAELDYLEEATRTERLREAVRDHEGIVVPAVIQHLTTSRVLTTEWIEGTPASLVSETELRDGRGKAIAHHLALSLLRQALEEGIFHGDPHAGNVRVCPDGRAAFLDFGSVTYIGRASREHLRRLLSAMFLQRADLLTTTLVNAGLLMGGADVSRFEREVDRLLAKHFGKGSSPELGDLVTEFLRVVYGHEGLNLQSEWVALLQSIALLEASCQRVDAEFDFLAVGKEIAQKSPAGELSLKAWLQEGLLSSREFGELIMGLPSRIERLLSRLEAGDLKLRHEAADADRFWHPLSGIANRLTVGIVVSAMLMATAILVSTVESGLATYAVWILFGLATVLGLSLLWSIVRSGRRR